MLILKLIHLKKDPSIGRMIEAMHREQVQLPFEQLSSGIRTVAILHQDFNKTTKSYNYKNTDQELCCL